jgi:hypothetical protein
MDITAAARHGDHRQAKYLKVSRYQSDRTFTALLFLWCTVGEPLIVLSTWCRRFLLAWLVLIFLPVGSYLEALGIGGAGQGEGSPQLTERAVYKAYKKAALKVCVEGKLHEEGGGAQKGWGVVWCGVYRTDPKGADGLALRGLTR